MGYFYAGGKTSQRTTARGKIGETNQKYLSQRVAQIRNTTDSELKNGIFIKENNFVVFEYLSIPNSTPAMTRAIEADVRFILERAGYVNVQNDHFEWRTTRESKMSEYADFASLAIDYAEQYCVLRGIEYTRSKGNENARKSCKRRK